MPIQPLLSLLEGFGVISITLETVLAILLLLLVVVVILRLLHLV
jgi:hypothetical protein